MPWHWNRAQMKGNYHIASFEGHILGNQHVLKWIAVYHIYHMLAGLGLFDSTTVDGLYLLIDRQKKWMHLVCSLYLHMLCIALYLYLL